MQTQTNGIARTTVVLHWSIALLVIGLIGLGLYMSSNEAYELFGIHGSIGLIAFVLIVIRIYWRLKSGWLPPVANANSAQIMAARVVQTLLLVCVLLMPLAGIMMPIAGGQGLYFFNLEIVTMNINPATM